MKAWGLRLAGLLTAFALAASPAQAARGRHAPRCSACCLALAGTVARVELAEAVSSETTKTRDRFAPRLAEPLIPAGTANYPFRQG